MDRGSVFGVLALAGLAVNGTATAADVPVMPRKAPAASPFDWSGLYVGGHFGYAAGASNWSATDSGGSAPALAGSLDLYNSFNALKGDGSYLAGLQAGYNLLLPSRVLLGVEADVSAPSTPVGITGSQTISSPATGLANYRDTVLQTGTVRGRVGYLFDNWLVYGTGGFAWSYDRLVRTQIAGTAAVGGAAPGDDESLFLWRLGWTAGAGVELPLAPNWSAKAEYQFSDFGRGNATFFTGAQRFDSDLFLHSVRVGLNYHINGDAAKSLLTQAPSALDIDRFNFHAQTTFVSQYAFPFNAPYFGPNSLHPNQGRETWDATFYAGFRLWEGAELWINPEIDQGFGLSGTLGVAGFTSGEAYKLGDAYPYARVPRAFIRQTIDLGGDSDKVEAGINQFAGSQTGNRLVLTAGKISVADIFDNNRYAHDPRGDFLNWALIDTATFDYAADAWGYSYGAATEWYQGAWTVRGGVFDLSIVPNSTELDPKFSQFQLVGELEHRHQLMGRDGKVALTGFLTRGRMGRFSDAIQLALATGQAADIAAVRQYASRGGLSVNLEQQISDDLGIFARAGWADGNREPYEFTDVDRTVAGGLQLKGKPWGRPDDMIGVAGVVNGISGAHRAFLDAGGLGILVGDGMLPHYGSERIIETYYNLPLFNWRVTLDYQFIDNPGYNRDRGPVSVIATRLRTQF
ncbi:MAG TPA: carbohydrate porin [Methylomirabilota bacterium]|nr:carbohydrate porin [Methylomirabilota bacterium]